MGVRLWLAKHELFAVLLIAVLFMVPFLGVVFQNAGFFGSYYDFVSVSYQENGNDVVVSESFSSVVSSSDSFNVLFRSFDDTVCLHSDRTPCTMDISSVSCSKGTPYYADQFGDVFNPSTGQKLPVPSAISYKFQNNEVGCFLYPSSFSGSTTTMDIQYTVPLSVVKEHNNKHTFFSNDHFLIKSLHVTSSLGSESVKRFIPADKRILISVSSGQVSASSVPLGLLVVLALAAFCTPLLIWNAFGKEKHVIVPKYLHVIPKKEMSPSTVDVLTNGQGGKLSKNGMAAILLELSTKKVFVFKEKSGFFNATWNIDVAKDWSKKKLSPKARSLAEFIVGKKVSETATHLTCSLNPKASDFQLFMKGFVKSDKWSDFADDKGRVFLMVLSIALPFVVGFTKIIPGFEVFVPLMFPVIFLVFMTPASVFSRFRDDNYKLFLEWVAFKNMLDDYAMINKYLKEDYVQWKKWLLYATALGSTKNLIKSLGELKLLSQAELNEIHSVHSSAILFSTAMVASSSSGSGGGSGGGFGGGGGGGR